MLPIASYKVKLPIFGTMVCEVGIIFVDDRLLTHLQAKLVRVDEDYRCTICHPFGLSWWLTSS
ncbi:MAG: hypothetical protein KME23_21295 [Goleter apudmare HA4340-LM2]|nr:hypothetical protein [Goleter apudmare HA4340-LM2]